MIPHRQDLALKIVNSNYSTLESVYDKINEKIRTNNKTAGLVIYLNHRRLVSRIPLLLNDFWEKVIIELERLSLSHELASSILALEVPEQELSEEEIGTAIFLNLKGVVQGFLSSTVEVRAVVLKCQALDLPNSFYQALLEAKFANNLYELTKDCPDFDWLKVLSTDNEMLETLKSEECNTFEKLQAYWTLKNYKIQKNNLTANEVLAINFVWNTAKLASDNRFDVLGVLTILCGNEQFANNLAQLISSVSLELLQDLFQAPVMDKKVLEHNTPEMLQANLILNRYGIPTRIFLYKEELAINFLWQAAACSNDKPAALSEWLNLLWEENSFRNSLCILSASITPKMLYDIVQYPEGLVLLKAPGMTLELFNAYHVLFSAEIIQEVSLTQQQINVINLFKDLNIAPLTRERFRDCLKELLKIKGYNNNYYNELKSLLRNVGSLVSGIPSGPIQLTDIAGMLQNDQGFELLKTQDVTTAALFLSYRFLLKLARKPEALTEKQARFIMPLDKIYHTMPNLKFDELVTSILADSMYFDNYILCNLSILANKEQEVSDEAIVTALVIAPHWITYLENNHLNESGGRFRGQYFIGYSKKELQALRILLLAGSRLVGRLDNNQIELINNSQIKEFNSRAVYQKIIDRPEIMKELLKVNVERLKIILKAIQFEQSDEVITLCSIKDSSSPIHTMLRYADTEEKVSYAAQFCLRLEQLENKLGEFHAREEKIAGALAIKLYITLDNLVSRHFNSPNWDDATIETFRTEVNHELEKPEYATLKEHRGFLLGFAQNVVAPAVTRFLWGEEQKITFFLTNSDEILQGIGKACEKQP